MLATVFWSFTSCYALPSGEGNGTPLQYSCLESPMGGGAWWAAVHEVVKSQTRLSNFAFNFHFPLSCIGEGNGNPLQCSCLENPRDGELGGLPSMGLHRVRHDWSDLAAAAAACSPRILHSKSWKTNNYISQISWPLGSLMPCRFW